MSDTADNILRDYYPGIILQAVVSFCSDVPGIHRYDTVDYLFLSFGRMEDNNISSTDLSLFIGNIVNYIQILEKGIHAGTGVDQIS
jgi:hypothetical protein